MVATDIDRKSPSRGSRYMGLRENIRFKFIFVFNIHCFLIITIMLLFLLVYYHRFYRYYLLLFFISLVSLLTV